MYSQKNDPANGHYHVDFVSPGKPIYYKLQPIEVTDEEYLKIKEIYDNKQKQAHSSSNGTNSNGVATALNIIALIIFILGFIAGIALGIAERKFSFTTLITCWVSAFVSGMIFLGFAEIIKLLNDIKHQKK